VTEAEPSGAVRLAELARLFLRLGATGFGGPAVHIALMHEEVVTRRRWLDEQHFLDLLGATSLIPGPTSTEMAIHVGFVRARWRGLVIAGACFMAPAVVIVLALAWAYVRYGATPAADALLYGVEPVVIAVVLQALLSLGKLVAGKRVLLVVGALVLILYLTGFNEVTLLIGAGVAAVLVKYAAGLGHRASALLAPTLLALQEPTPAAVDLSRVLSVFLKFGAVVFGSGYVLLAFMRSDLVERLAWITDRQLLDAIAVGQLTPGPVFTTATFVGYLIGGLPAALLATLGIFLPSFLLVAAVNPLVPKLRRSPLASALLDGVNAGALGLMAGVTWQLGRRAVVDVPAAILFAAALVVLLRYRINSAWVIGAGALAGALISLFGQV
jgi:chromate transporter